jgi:hypothetical protein
MWAAIKAIARQHDHVLAVDDAEAQARAPVRQGGKHMRGEMTALGRVVIADLLWRTARL